MIFNIWVLALGVTGAALPALTRHPLVVIICQLSSSVPDQHKLTVILLKFTVTLRYVPDSCIEERLCWETCLQDTWFRSIAYENHSYTDISPEHHTSGKQKKVSQE